MTLNKIVYDIKEILNQYSLDTEISDRYIIYLYQIKRSKYLSQDVNNPNKTIDDSIIQSYCAKLEEVNSNVCNINIGCDTLLRTSEKVPELIGGLKVKPVNIVSKPFNFIESERVVNLDGSPFPGSIYAFEEGRYIYLYSFNNDYKNLECINISGVFENPLDFLNKSKCCNCKDSKSNKCFDIMKSDYPLQSKYIDYIRKDILKDLILKEKLPEDKINDTDNLDK